MTRDLLTSAFTRLHAQLLARARRVVGEDDALDALQEAFYRLWRTKATPQTAEHAAGMLTKTAMNICIDTVRRQADRRMQSIDEHTDDVAEADNDSDSREAIIRHVNSIISQHLTERDRMILLRRDRDGWEFDELAEEYGITEANARMIVARARRTVREIYNRQQNNRTI